jgi:RecA/RadA recombinase
MTKKIKEVKVETESGKIITSQDQLKSFLKNNKDSHYNFEESIEYKISSGSLLLDYFLNGGIGTGLHRFCGINEGGKTSCALQFMKNFLDQPKKRKGFYIKAEGRLSKEMIARSGVKFVFNDEEWVEGTCFVFESNIHETVFDSMRELVGKNDEKIQYFFLLDSVDGLIRKGDLEKTFEESQKVAGGAVIAADLMKRMSIALQKRGHVAVFVSQVRADIKLDPYSKAPIRQTTATGGNALLHFANWIFEFDSRFKGDLILEDPTASYDEQKNPYLGHFVKIIVKKSPNERTNCTIRYPIKYGRKNGTSNWIEKEIFDFLTMWEIAIKKGAWISFDEEFLNILKEAGFTDFPAQIQGSAKFEQMVNNNEKLKSFFFKYISENLLNFGDGISITE